MWKGCSLMFCPPGMSKYKNKIERFIAFHLLLAKESVSSSLNFGILDNLQGLLIIKSCSCRSLEESLNAVIKAVNGLKYYFQCIPRERSSQGG